MDETPEAVYPDTPGPAQPPPATRRTHPAGQREFAIPAGNRPQIKSTPPGGKR